MRVLWKYDGDDGCGDVHKRNNPSGNPKPIVPNKIGTPEKPTSHPVPGKQVPQPPKEKRK